MSKKNFIKFGLFWPISFNITLSPQAQLCGLNSPEFKKSSVHVMKE